MTILLDSSVVIALLREEHQQHAVAEMWFASVSDGVATCPITQGALVRLSMQREESAGAAVEALRSLTNANSHEFWPDDVGYDEVRMTGVLGHRQVTDAYLAQLAREHGGRIATFDRAFAALHNDVAELIPVGG